MPKKAAAPPPRAKASFSISYGTIGALVGVLTILGAMYAVGSKVATKDDVATITAQITPKITEHEKRIYDIEIQLARQFGASQTKTAPSVTDLPEQMPRMVLSQYIQKIPNASQQQQVQIAPRREVVPIEMIKTYNMEPSRGGTLAVLGEDGRAYSIDDVLAILIRIHFAERNRK